MSIEKARDYLRGYGLDGRIQEFAVSSATVELAAQALNVEPARIAKSLTFADGDGCLMLVAAGDARIANPKFKSQFGMKASMLSAENVERLVGHAVGGVCPFGVASAVTVYLDESLKRFETVFPAAGSSNSAVEMTPDELFKVSGAKQWVDVCKLPETQA